MITDHLDRIGIEQGLAVVNRLSKGSDTCVLRRDQVGRHLINDRRRNHRLITLHIDHTGVVRQTQLTHYFLQAISPGRMVRPGHDCPGAKTSTGIHDALIIGGHNHRGCTALARLLPDMLDHRLAVNQLQWLAG